MNLQEFTILVFCIITASWVYFHLFYTRKTPRILHGVEQCRDALRKSTLASRAAPNKRLEDVFNIDNAFTTTDSVYHAEFVRGIRLKLDTRDDEWNTLATFAFNNLRHTLLLNQVMEEDGKFVQLAPLVQSLVFRVILLKFFPEIPKPSEHDVEFITTRINSLWLTTKHYASCANSNILEIKKQLEVRLQRVFEKAPNQRISGRENPLNTIIPAPRSSRVHSKIRISQSGTS
jgi:hypothetical protein